MAFIHHATARRATSLGVSLAQDEQGFVACKDGQTATGDTAKNALDALVEMLDDEDAADDAADHFHAELDDEIAAEADSEADTSRSVVKAKYRALYKPNGGTCGDGLSKRLKNAFHVQTENGPRLDMEAFREFARANECWVESYRSLDNGQQRMCVGNRLRNRVRQGEKIVGWPTK